MNVWQICQRNLVTARHFAELTSAAQLMREKHFAVVEPAFEDGTFTPMGVLTVSDDR